MLDRLETQPHSFDFFYTLRLLQALHLTEPRVGESVRLREDIVRLCQVPHLRFTPSDLETFRPGIGSEAPRLSVNFLGFLGPNGPLPIHITEYVRQRLRDGDDTIASLLDVLQHRSLSLFFRAWALNQKTVDLDRREGRRFATYVASLAGLGMPSLQKRDEVPDLAKLYFAGRLSCVAKNPEGLSAILTAFFGIPCEIQNYSGHWIRIPPSAACRLGDTPATGSLGTTLIVGSKVWQVQTKFRARLGPMSFADLERLLPNHKNGAWRRLKDWVRNYIGAELLWDAQLALRAEEVPATRLGSGGFLGWTTWINTRPPTSDAEDVILDTDLN